MSIGDGDTSNGKPLSRADHSSDAEISLTVDTPRMARIVLVSCVTAELAFVALDYHINYGNLIKIGAIQRLFNIAREDGLASYFATTQTLLAALTLWLIYIATRHRPGPKWRAIGWLVLAVFFTYMAVDDGSKIHERIGTTFEKLFSDESAWIKAFPSYYWQIAFLPIFGTMGIFLLLFLWVQLATTSSRILIIVALGCLVTAVCMDFVEGLSREHRWNIYTMLSSHFDEETWKRVGHYNELEAWTHRRFGESAYDTLRHFSKSIEETLEMFANSLFWFLFLRHLATAVRDLRIRFLR